MSDSETSKKDNRVPCKYGSSCYQKNEAHHKKYRHPNKTAGNEADQSKSPMNTNKENKNATKPKNALTNWLKPPNKKQKLEDYTHGDASASKQTDSVISTSDLNKDVVSDEISSKADSLTSKDNQQINNSDSSNESDSSSNVRSISLAPIKMDAKTRCKTYFLVDMPDDFYKFWEFCESVGNLLLSKGNPLDSLKSVGLKLVGPFDVLANKFNENVVYDNSALLRHYRFYYDPPEFQTVIIRTDDTSEYHLGYFRDDPKDNPVFVASNCAAENGIIKSVAENLFGAVNVYLEEYKKKADPFAKLKVVRLQNSLTAFAKQENITLSTSTTAMKKREAKVVTKTFHKAGLVVPFNKKTELGYRELAESDATIKKILTSWVNSKSEEERKAHFSKFYPIVTYANIANDECDFGTSLELGLDLFTFGSPDLHETSKRLMTTSYQLLQRTEFATIIEAHLEDRRKGSNLSIFNKK